MNAKNELCPICAFKFSERGHPNADEFQYDCLRCGKFSLSGTARTVAMNTLVSDEKSRPLLSHFIREMQTLQSWPLIDSAMFDQIIKTYSLPKPAEQAINLLRWLGKKADWSDTTIVISCEELQATIGAKTLDSVFYVSQHLSNRGLIWFDRTDTAKSTPPLKFRMSFDGWQEYERLQSETNTSKTVFMAMKYGDAELDNVVQTIFRPAVAATGFELRILTDVPRAGLIDDRLRVEIRQSSFLIADITHRNLGAYWEAGFAEGLGKQVIYTCKRNAFDDGASHFDTNHHLTVMWGDEQYQVTENLKATIRATFPSLAKQYD